MSEGLFFCPLECGVRIKNLTRHLSKCINFKLLGVKYRQCEYNKMHIIKNELYQIHLLSCDSKKKYDEDQSDSDDDDDDLANKFTEDSDKKDENKNKENENNNKKEETNDLENKNENENENENENDDNNPYKRKRRYRHERALFKNEKEIDQECLDFFNKVYI
jgi:hypothetical protein